MLHCLLIKSHTDLELENVIDLALQYQGPIAYLSVVILGYTLQKYKLITSALTLFISKTLVRVLYPCLIFSSIVQQYSRQSLMEGWTMPLGAFLILFTGYVLGKPLSKGFPSLGRKELGTFRFMTTMPNYIFLPLPICQALWGDKAVAILIFSIIQTKSS